MIELTGPNLSKRHQELNTKVIEAAKSNIDFEEVKNKIETSDVDKLFKIDLASKYRNINYILDVLKSGDNLYISRALSNDWIIHDEFAQFINPQYLEQNIFPFMSRKMKNKVLASIYLRLRNDERVKEFHHYCMDKKMRKHGMNFLLYTNDSFKMEFLALFSQNFHEVYNDFERTPDYLERFIGTSFILTEQYLKIISGYHRSFMLYKLNHLYSSSQEMYLDLLEIYHYRTFFWVYSKRFSRSIMKKHKERVLKDPSLYVKLLNKDILVEYSSSDDARVYAVALLPNTSSEFWHEHYYNSNVFFLNKIPLGERFTFIKKIFTEKYPVVIFEDCENFYTDKCYMMMTQQEKEEWALRRIASGEEAHGPGNDYIWYRFVNFQQAFLELEKCILITPDNNKRTKILEILTESAKTQEDFTTLLEYYYNRHVNEVGENKRRFMNKVIENHDVLQFDDKCWDAFDKILHSLDIYTTLINHHTEAGYRTIALKYRIIHEKPVPDVLYEHVISRHIRINAMRHGFSQHFDLNKLNMIFLYMLSCYTKHIEKIINSKTDENIRELDGFIRDVLDLAVDFDKTFEDIPDLVKGYVISKIQEFSSYRLVSHLLDKPEPEFCTSDIVHYLKKDASLVVKEFNKIKALINVDETTTRHCKNRTNLNWLIRKLKIYFHHDIAQEYTKLLNECLSTEDLYLRTAQIAVFGLFNLTDEEFKINFLKKYVPTNPKIDHVNISRNLLTIQTAICSMACRARPPLPHTIFRDYIKGDYLQYCTSIFDSYLANLTPDQFSSFVASLLDSPVSVQKHALRLAFHCFSIKTLKDLVLQVWKKMKNVSLRKVLYKATIDRINLYSYDHSEQLEVFEVLAVMTNSLHQDDDDEVFNLLITNLPSPILGKHLEIEYKVVSEFPQRLINFERASRVIDMITSNMLSVSEDFLRLIMKDHITAVLDQNLTWGQTLKDGHMKVIESKWSLIKTAIIEHKNIIILDMIVDKCLSNWRETHDNEYVYRKFLLQFLTDIENSNYTKDVQKYLDLNEIFRHVLEKIQISVPDIEIYLTVWKYKVNILTWKILGELGNADDKDPKDTLFKFSFAVKDIIKEYIEKGMFYRAFHGEIKDLLLVAIRKILESFLHQNSFVFLHGNIVLCSVLSEIEDRAMHLFILDLMPKIWVDPLFDEYLRVIDKLKSIEDEEIKYYMSYMFYTSDYMYRDFFK